MESIRRQLASAFPSADLLSRAGHMGWAYHGRLDADAVGHEPRRNRLVSVGLDRRDAVLHEQLDIDDVDHVQGASGWRSRADDHRQYCIAYKHGSELAHV